MKKLEIGIEFWPWNSCNDILDYAKRAMESHPYDCVWMCDEFQYEDAITILGAMALQLDASIGTLVTFPWRNPLELAQRFGTIAKLVRPGRQVALGMGGGGSVQIQVIGEKTNPFAVMKESVILLRSLLNGQQVELAQFPQLASRFRYNTTTRTKLYFPPPVPVPVYLAAGGPKMLALAGEHADGVVFTQLVARTSLLGLKFGFLKEAVDTVEAARSKRDGDQPFKKIYNAHVSVSRDGKQARQWGKRNASYGLAGTFIRYPEVLDAVGLDREEVGHVAEAYLKGLGVDEAARRVSDELLQKSGAVIAGTPEEVRAGLVDLKAHLLELGFDHLVVGVPLGPDVPEALDLLGREVVPALRD